MNAVQFPTITVGDRALTVRYSLAAQVLMRRRGIDPRHLLRYISPFKVIEGTDGAGDSIAMQDGKPVFNEDNNVVENVLKVFSCMVAENLMDQSHPERYDLNMAPTSDYWTALIHPLQFPDIEAVIGEAMGKATEERRKLLLVVAPPSAQSAATVPMNEQTSQAS